MKFTSPLLCFILIVAQASLGTASASLRIPLTRRTISRKPNRYDKRSTSLHHTLKGLSNLAFVGEVDIGTPPQKFLLQFDTGSPTLWVPGSTCTDQDCTIHPQYDPGASSTSHSTDLQESMVYADQSGNNLTMVSDSITVAGIKLTQVFGVATSLTGFNFAGLDGIFGLGNFMRGGYTIVYDVDNQPRKIILPLQNMYDKGIIKLNQFSMWLNFAANNGNSDRGGEIIFGEVDQTHFKGPMVYERLVLSEGLASKFWTIPLRHVSIKGHVNYAFPSGVVAIIDSGTSYSFIPTANADAIFSQFGAIFDSNLGVYKWHCPKGPYSYPNMKLTFGSHTLTLPNIAWLFTLDVLTNNTADASSCYSKILPMEGMSAWILGDIFMRWYYTLFDVAQERIGFAPVIGWGKTT